MGREPKAVAHLLLIGACLAVVAPMVWMLVTAWKTPAEIYASGFRPWPADPTLENFVRVLRDVPMGRFFLNSLVVAAGITLARLLTSILAAYAFARFAFWGREILFYLFVATMLVPFQVIMIPIYLTVTALDWLNTYQGLIVPHVASGFGVFLLRQHFKAFPVDFTDAARIDGASQWQTLWKVVVPSNATAIWSLAVLFFIDAWNQYLWPLLIATEKPMQTLPVGIQLFINPEGGTQWGPLMASATLAIVPSILLYVFAQRHILESAVSSGIRG
jgi:sn-glycerol 3-phosphate transport system permease protein